MFLQSNKPLSHDNDDVDEKFGDLSHLWGDQFTHPCPLGTSFTQSRVWDKDGAGEIYCPDICPYNSPVLFLQHLNIVHPTKAGYPTMLWRLDYVPCAHHSVPTTLHSRLSHYLDRIWRGTNWKSPKYAHVPMLPFQPSNQCDTILLPDALSCERNAFYNQAFGNQCPQCTETNCLGLQKALFVVNVSISPSNPYILDTQKCKYRKSVARLDIV